MKVGLNELKRFVTREVRRLHESRTPADIADEMYSTSLEEMEDAWETATSLRDERDEVTAVEWLVEEIMGQYEEEFDESNEDAVRDALWDMVDGGLT